MISKMAQLFRYTDDAQCFNMKKTNKRRCVNDLTTVPRSKIAKPNNFSLLEDFCFKCPLVGEMVIESIDNQSLINFKKISRHLHSFLENGRHLWKRMIKHNLKNFKEFQNQWKMVIKKIPVKFLEELAKTTHRFFLVDTKHFWYQWAPIHIAAQQGSL